MYNTPLSHIEPDGFRQATFSDMSHVWRLVYNAYSDYIPLLGRTPPTFLEDFDSHVALGNTWLCEHGGNMAAMVVLTPMLDHMLIQAMCVDPLLQGQGLGQRLLSYAEHRAAVLGLRELRLYTNSMMIRNVKIYRRWGFKQTHVESYAWGKRVHMRKAVTAKRKSVRRNSTSALEHA